MTKRATITATEIDRIMRAARREGFDAEIRKPDGTVITFKLRAASSSAANDIDGCVSAESKWDDVAA
jgi:hypothetical protein